MVSSALGGLSWWSILWTAVLAPVAYVVYQVVGFLVDVRRRGRAVDQFPGDKKHWLWGHMHLVGRWMHDVQPTAFVQQATGRGTTRQGWSVI